MGHTATNELRTFAELQCDPFEQSLVPIIRRLVRTLGKQDAIGCCQAYDRAIEKWGDPIGLSIAHLMQKLITELTKCRGAPLTCFYPRERAELVFVSHDEFNLLKMLHHMRREDFNRASQPAEYLMFGKRAPKVMRAASTFAQRYKVAQGPPNKGERHRVRLSIVAKSGA
ncbi:hypothetical protein [Cognatiyoonia sp. IB215182]|uniref:hypothetical protein n=1 Tax=Cognatiyoonia sp. IB215182 TaxID=3097353 RepID=UPI002A1480F5|nr:hypothetical protein [Cognatiyoonia sp. IB215182]MDX8355736.1 hypothetical protein [Cognatiyoonia sp. IB215182]